MGDMHQAHTQNISEAMATNTTPLNEQRFTYAPDTTTNTQPPVVGIGGKNLNSQTQWHSRTSIAQDKCLCLSNFRRQQLCLSLLSSRLYPLSYVLVILVMGALFAYDLWDLRIDNSTMQERP